jgi:hypothetical protein
MREKPVFTAIATSLGQLGRMQEWLAEAGGFEPRYGGLEIIYQTLSPVRKKRQNLFPLKFISNSKRSNFENRTEWMESRASERNGPFGEQ